LSRIVGHLDLDYFYAQVEEVENPSLKDTPVVVCVYSGRTEDSGVVSTANYKAREYGVKSAMPIALAKSRLKDTDATFIAMDHAKYETYSERIMELIRVEVDTLDQTGIDEAFFDITKRAGGDYSRAEAIARSIKSKVLAEEKLTCTVGIGPNKVVAKIASDLKKPDGLTVVRETEARAFLSPLPVDKIYGVGPKTARLLEEKGVSTVKQLADFPAEHLDDLLGKKFATYLRRAAEGVDDEPVVDRGESTQLSRIVTLKHDSGNLQQILAELSPAVRDLHERLVSRNLYFRTLSVIGITKSLSQRTKSKTLEAPTNEYSILERETRTLFGTLVLETGVLRRAGVRLSGLQDMVNQQSLTEFTS
jgi:DNA polymerase IV (DinB-like DNA polymerase)